MQLRTAKEEEEKKQLRNLLQNYQNMADAAYAKKKEDKEFGENDSSYRTFIFDLEQVSSINILFISGSIIKFSGTPYITADKVFYLRQLSTYNLTVHDGVSGNSAHFM